MSKRITHGYKVFDKNLQCRGYQFEIGKRYKHHGPIGLCSSGFHFCKRAIDCYDYYSFDSTNRVCEVKAYGRCESDNKKSVCSEIVIVRELNWHEVRDLANVDRNNTGFGNAGNFNTGHFNTGRFNAGRFNAGNFNTGHFNTGDFNAGNYNTGFFCTETNPFVNVFDKPSGLTCIEMTDRLQFLSRYPFDLTKYVQASELSEEERIKYPNGVTKSRSYNEAWAIMWGKMSAEDRERVKQLPNFDAEKFLEITGIDLRGEENE